MKRQDPAGKPSSGSTAPNYGVYGRRPRGDEGQYIAVPQPGRIYLPGTTIPAIGSMFVARPDGLLVPIAAARQPQPIDLIKTYVTHSDLFGYPAEADFVIDALGAVPRDDFVVGCAALLGTYEGLNASRRDIDQRLAAAWFKGPAVGKITAIIGDHATLVAPQSLLLLMQFAIVRSPLVPDPEATPRPFAALILALQDGLGTGDVEESTVFTGDPHSALFRQIVASHHFGQSDDVATLIVHHHIRWERLSASLRAEPGAVDLKATFLEATGVPMDDVTSVALAIWAHCETHGSYPVPASALDAFNIPHEMVNAALDLISATPSQIGTEIAAMPPAYQTEWSFDVLRRYPLLRLDSGDILVMSKALLLDRVYGWLPMFDMVEGLKARRRRKDAERAENWFRHLCELDALSGIEEMAGASRLYREGPIQVAFGTAEPNADAALEYPDAWVVIEIGTHQLTRATVVAREPDALESDLKLGIDEKAAQLDATIRQLLSDESRLTGKPPLPRTRIIPVLVLTEGFPVNPMTMTAIRERLQALGLFGDPRVGPLHVLDQEELDMAEAISEEGGPSLLQLLIEHEGSTLALSAFKDWLILARGRGAGPRRPRRLEALRDEAWQPALDRLRRAEASAGDRAVTPELEPVEPPNEGLGTAGPVEP